MYDIVYPLAENKSKYRDDFEIRYSLRSVEKFVNVGKVYIVGYKPEWLTNVEYIYCTDPYVIKDANIINKILLACYNIESQEFIRMSDDEYFLNPYVPRTYAIGDLKNAKNEGWHKTSFNTRDILLSKGNTAINYDCHCPQLIDKDRFFAVLMNSSWAQGDGLLANSYFFNSMITKFHAPSIQPIAPKVNRFKSPQDEYVLDGDFLNHNDAGLTPKLRSIIEGLFPEKSRYEL